MHARRPVLLSTALTLLLAACGQPQGESPAEVDPYANGANYPWSYIAPEGRLTTLSLTPGENNLYFEPILAASNGWGPVEIDRSNGEQAAGDGRTLSINGKTYTRGYGVHAGSELRFSLKGTGANCTRFTADVGVDDEVGKKGKVVFQVFLDGVKAYDSGAMKGKDPARLVDLDITGKQELRLVVTDAGNGINYDHADWAQPKIFCVATTPPTTPPPTPPPAGPSGTLDPSFDSDGIVVTNFDGGETEASAVVQQPDGKVVAVGSMYSFGIDTKTVVARYNSDGSLDPSFGSAGTAVLNLIIRSADSPVGFEKHSAVALQKDGKILVGGGTSGLTPLMARLTPTGALDPTFGNGGVVIVPELEVGEVTELLVLSDGRFLVNGSRAVRRYHPNGTVDTTFANAGTLERQENGQRYIADIALQSTGQILVLTSNGYLKRFTADGQLDTSFGTNGQIGYEVWRSAYQEFSGVAVAVLPGDHFLVGLSGRTISAGGGSRYEPPVVDDDSMLVKHEPNGAPISSFGTGGRVFYPDGYGFYDLQALQDGSLLARTVRYNADGTFRQSYSQPDFEVRSSSVQADGRILLVGKSIEPPCFRPCSFTVARLFP
ncbi:hypothetical protein GCM10008955_31010 [Deinococcus malanensis]|uniref:Glycosyl hydrolase family 98 putative carbohydrate-binding module domain-containing protein n=1 Tax=Deinococcus malanensis TaxID=1706855 RepID=A0ABQ2EZZ8_9DEIO|nr:NPCBM/NEW2 domain-containing protein [Deinococcus malanensis]GGK34871.1 hypothetical protein GCM10008955_31010 [Deinococcus malanensis]